MTMKKILLISIFSVALICACGNESRFVDPDATGRLTTLKVPSHYPTIQAAIDSAKHGDSILVADGFYDGAGNRNISTLGKTLIITSENGPLHTVIDCGGGLGESHAAFVFENGQNNVVIDGFTVVNGNNNNGGAIYCPNASPTIRNCIFRNNNAPVSGGVVWIKGSNAAPVFINCTFVGNSSPAGAVMFLLAGASPQIRNCLFILNESQPIELRDNTCEPQFSCTDIWNNEMEDWNEDIADWLNQNGNVSVDPLMCNPLEFDYRLQSGSPCLPENSECDSHIGAVAETCDPT